jgi:transcriptional regulator with XRE-family HTH domain
VSFRPSCVEETYLYEEQDIVVLSVKERHVSDISSNEWSLVGERIRSARMSTGITVRELARRIDVSASHVSQVERGLSSFSVRSLYTVAGILGVSMDSLFSPETEATAGLDVPPHEKLIDSTLEAAAIVQRAANRPTITMASGPRWERLTPRPEASSEFIEVIYSPADPNAEPPQDFVRHDGREYGIITRGKLTVHVGFESTVLSEGDSIAFDSSVPHKFWNETPEEVRAVWFVLDQPTTAASDGSSLPTSRVSSFHPH